MVLLPSPRIKSVGGVVEEEDVERMELKGTVEKSSTVVAGTELGEASSMEAEIEVG